jgi:hypothetical protein
VVSEHLRRDSAGAAQFSSEETSTTSSSGSSSSLSGDPLSVDS